MLAYLAARRVPRLFEPEVRADYCLASVSNGLSGAIRYHLAMVADAAAPDPARANASMALIAWERVVRRAAAVLKTSLNR